MVDDDGKIPPLPGDAVDARIPMGGAHGTEKSGFAVYIKFENASGDKRKRKGTGFSEIQKKPDRFVHSAGRMYPYTLHHFTCFHFLFAKFMHAYRRYSGWLFSSDSVKRELS